MGYLDLVKQMEAAKAAGHPPVSPEEARAIINGAWVVVDQLAAAYSPGALAWAEANRPGLAHECIAAYKAVQAAFADKDLVAVREATADFAAANQALFAAFTGREKPGNRNSSGYFKFLILRRLIWR